MFFFNLLLLLLLLLLLFFGIVGVVYGGCVAVSEGIILGFLRLVGERGSALLLAPSQGFALMVTCCAFRRWGLLQTGSLTMGT